MSRALTTSLLATSLATSLAGCPDRSVAKLEPDPTGAQTKTIPVSADIDILFVIDNSASTLDKQTVFAANFPRFVQALDAFPTGRPNVHVGVITTTVDIGVQIGGDTACHPASGDDGRLQTTPRVAGCAPPSDAFISDVAVDAGTRRVNYPGGDLAATLSCIAQVGTKGCGFESPLEAIKRALDGRHPENAGFLRPGAFLAVVVLTDEDDCSARDPALFTLPADQAGPGDFRCQPLYAYTCDQPIAKDAPGDYTNCAVRTDSYLRDPAEYFQFLSTVKDPSRLVVALIGGDPKTSLSTGPITQPFAQDLALEPSCSATIGGHFAIGRPALRLGDFVDRFGDHGLFRTVCQADYSQALGDIGTLLFQAVSPCLDGSLDVTDRQPANPGLQPDCAVTEVVGLDTPDETQAVLPACAMTDDHTPAPAGARPCWWVAPDAAACATATTLALHVERSEPPAPGTNVRVSCATTGD